MKFKTWKRIREVECGVTLHPDGTEMPFAQDTRFEHNIKVPVLWKGKKALMYFDHGNTVFEFNSIATQMLNHPHIAVGGPVHIMTHVEWRHKMKVWAQEEYVMNAIAALQFDVPPMFGPTRHSTVDIYAATPADLVAVRMCI